ncbi:MAG: beta strand repeat-containing protein, partial [Pirellula sp.]
MVVTGTGATSVPSGLTNATLRSFLSVTPTAILNGTQTTNTLTWNFNSGSEAFNFLATGETLVLTYTVSATDDDGSPLSDTETVTITITGTADAPVITGGPDTSSLTETNAGLNDTGTFTVTDLDLTDNVTAAVDSVVVTGTGASSVPAGLTNATLRSFLSVTPTAILNGSQTTNTLTWNFYSGSEEFNFLATVDTLVLTYTVSATDDDGSPLSDTEVVTVTITGTNDAPLITMGSGDSAAATLTETNSTLTSSGTLTVSDLDLTDLVSSSVTGVVASGTTAGLGANNAALLAMLTSTANVLDATELTDKLTWNFNSSGQAFDYLATGESLTLTYTIEVTDSHGATASRVVVITIDGSADAPVITDGPDSVGLLATGSGLTTTSSLTVTDLDRSDIVTASVDSVSVSGTGAMNAPASLSNAAVASFLSVSPTTILDSTQTSAPLTWTFNSGSEAFSFLAVGETYVMVYTVRATDNDGIPLSDTETVTITITGGNSTPNVLVDTGDSAAATLAETNGTLTTSGTLSVTDPNVSDIVTSSVTGVVASGTTSGLGSNNAALLAMLTSTANVLDNTETSDRLTWNFSSGGEAFNYLATGESLTLTYTIEVQDSQGAVDAQLVTITITGTADAPVITGGPDTASLIETNAGLSDTGTFTVTDLDLTDNVTAAVDSVVVTGTGASSVPAGLTNATLRSFLSVTPTAVFNGTQTTNTLTWNFNSGSEAFNFLATGETLVLTYTVSATDDDGSPLSDTEVVTVTITGTNDAPLITMGSGDSAAA